MSDISHALVQGLMANIRDTQQELDSLHTAHIESLEESFIRLYEHVAASPFAHLTQGVEKQYESIENARLYRNGAY